MNLFLDTHVLLWWLDNSPYLSEAGRSAIADPDNLIFLSAVVIWEKAAKNKSFLIRERPRLEI
jgi:PIN domain nuclease of toxin-antitoxin system